ncbi:MAG: F0F1 ATP synthase subunit B [Clostridiales bacterium]|nr:F0F1 ATP synthase subunit B [Clostridiales bacterium]
MNNLDVISLNIWQIIISLLNLVILFLLFRKFLFEPVKKVIAKRQTEVESVYDKAAKAQDEADELKSSWESKMKTAQDEADKIVKEATEKADRRNEVMLYESREKAESIIRKAKADAERSKADAEEYIRKEIIDVSAAMTEQILAREINMDDHKDLIDGFIDNLDGSV